MFESLVKFGPGIIMAGIGAYVAGYFLNRKTRQMSTEERMRYRKVWLIPMMIFGAATVALGDLIGYLIWAKIS